MQMVWTRIFLSVNVGAIIVVGIVQIYAMVAAKNNNKYGPVEMAMLESRESPIRVGLVSIGGSLGMFGEYCRVVESASPPDVFEKSPHNVMLPPIGERGPILQLCDFVFGCITSSTAENPVNAYSYQRMRTTQYIVVPTTGFTHALLWAFPMIVAYRTWRMWRRRKLGLCPQCGYSWRYSSSERCPECGQATESRNAQSAPLSPENSI